MLYFTKMKHFDVPEELDKKKMATFIFLFTVLAP